jgi:hypothetical protein
MSLMISYPPVKIVEKVFAPPVVGTLTTQLSSIPYILPVNLLKFNTQRPSPLYRNPDAQVVDMTVPSGPILTMAPPGALAIY